LLNKEKSEETESMFERDIRPARRAAKTIICSFLLAVCGASAAHAAADVEPIAAVVDRDVQVAAAQYRVLLAKVAGKPGFPRSVAHGDVRMVGPGDWTAGFFPGSLWYLFEATGDATWKTAAMRYTALTAPAKFDKTQHDLGFMLGTGYGNGLRLVDDPATRTAYRDALLAGATTLMTRFNPKVGSIQSWDLWPNTTWAFPVIIDNMMNLELLLWAARAADEPRYREVAIAHADTALKNHFRPDGSSFHLVDYDPKTGAVRARMTVQGYANGSAWARGQAWGLYGYTMMYRETHKDDYLQQAHRIARFYMNHPRLPADRIPFWDFDDPAIPAAPRDSSAAAIAASALLELASFSDRDTAARYRDFAEQTLRSLSSGAYLAQPGDNGGFLLKHATGHKPAGTEIDGPLNYADYYFLEALLRMKAARTGIGSFH
jgi:rhamnogalacturonyl hydrolase YesR